MRALYVLTHGAKIHKHVDRIVVEAGLGHLATIVMPNTVQITTQTLTATPATVWN